MAQIHSQTGFKSVLIKFGFQKESNIKEFDSQTMDKHVTTIPALKMFGYF